MSVSREIELMVRYISYIFSADAVSGYWDGSIKQEVIGVGWATLGENPVLLEINRTERGGQIDHSLWLSRGLHIIRILL